MNWKESNEAIRMSPIMVIVQIVKTAIVIEICM